MTDITIESTIFIKKNDAYNDPTGTKPKTRQVFLRPASLDDIPAALFGVKVSQSKKPELAGKTLFKHFAFQIGTGDDSQPNTNPFNNLAPEGVTVATPVEEIRSIVVSKLANIPNINYSIVISLNGDFSNITTADGTFEIFNRQKYPDTDGDPNYYIKSDEVIKVTLKEAVSAFGPYFQVRFASPKTSNEIFQKRQQGVAWGEDETTASSDASLADTEPQNGSVW